LSKSDPLEISYDDLQKLLKEFREQMDLLKEKLKEDEAAGTD